MSRKFRDYLRYSSFPQAVQLYKINPDNINLFLDGIYNTILFKDVMQRKGITDKNVLERVTKYLYNNIGNRTSMKSISDNKILDRELTPLKKIHDNYLKYILTLDDDLDADFDGIKKINVLDWLLEEK